MMLGMSNNSIKLFVKRCEAFLQVRINKNRCIGGATSHKTGTVKASGNFPKVVSAVFVFFFEPNVSNNDHLKLLNSSE